MTTRPTPYRIVVGIDFSELSLRALDQAFSMAALRPGSQIHLVVAVADADSELVPSADRRASLIEITDHVRDRLAAHGTNALQAFRAAEPAAAPFPLVAHVRVGPSADQLAALAGEIQADLVIVGTHGRRGLQRAMTGSVAERVVRIAPCPVLVVRPMDKHTLDGVPKLYPACPSCVSTRERTHGAQWWCDAHAVAPEPAHTFSHSRRLDEPPQPAFGR